MEMKEREFSFDPRAYRHLGRDLITSVDVALLELVKNSVDAGAKEIKIDLFSYPEKSSEFSAAPFRDLVPSEYLDKPLLVVSDDGCGMTSEVIDSAFLRVGTDFKLGRDEMLGSKGIGRLASQRLGDLLVVESSTKEDKNIVFAIINWNAIFRGETSIPSMETEGIEHHTRLWIFGANIEDYIDNVLIAGEPALLSEGGRIYLRSEVESALFFVISPFEVEDTGQLGSYAIKRHIRPRLSFTYDGFAIELDDPLKMLALSESKHFFSLNFAESTFAYGLDLKPWYIERVHRSMVGPRAFSKLRKSHSFYNELLDRYRSRFRQALCLDMEVESLIGILAESAIANERGSGDIADKEALKGMAEAGAAEELAELELIGPIYGEIYSFRQDAAIGRDIVLSSVKELEHFDEKVDIKEIKQFLDDYNGIKLYRGVNRIGFLGNKESDWIRLQQYKTKGQQFYRFDLGNIVGFVSIQDPRQARIEEISSRLDIQQNRCATALKRFVEIVFNQMFYELNRRAVDLIKTALKEEGVVGEPIAKELDENRRIMRDLADENQRLRNLVSGLRKEMGAIRKEALASNSYDASAHQRLAVSAKSISLGLENEKKLHKTIGESLDRMDEQLQLIHVEAYNNFKLMANGLITESITHQLDSFSHTSLPHDAGEHFDFLKQYLVEKRDVRAYNKHVFPLKNSFELIEETFASVNGLYSLLDDTFVHKDSYDSLVAQNIESVVRGVWDGLLHRGVKDEIQLRCNLGRLEWLAPEGTLVHVFYNLFDNSLYWIRNNPFKGMVAARKGEIEVKAGDNGAVVISDSGPGVARGIEDVLFAPLESAKPPDERRGMGLYIVKRLLNSFGSDIVLLDERNNFGNRFSFMLIPSDEHFLPDAGDDV